MDTILQEDAGSGAERALDALYRTALESAGSWDDREFVADFTAMMGLVLVAQHPLSCTAIDHLLGLPSGRPSIHTTSHLGCVLQQKPTVRVLHPSFADFLLTRSRCSRDDWFFDQTTHNRILAIQCIRHLDNVLKQNICNMTLSVGLGNENVPEDVSYACLFWVDHLCTIKDDIIPVIEHLDTFLHQHLLHWFEAMSIMRKSRDIVALLDSLLAWIIVSFTISSFRLACANPSMTDQLSQ